MALKPITCRIEDFDRARLERIARQRGKHPTAVLREALERYLDSIDIAQKKSA